eukprot:scaffold24106_cov75-Phaeocystis_antarctica.AAC.2
MKSPWLRMMRRVDSSTLPFRLGSDTVELSMETVRPLGPCKRLSMRFPCISGRMSRLVASQVCTHVRKRCPTSNGSVQTIGRPSAAKKADAGMGFIT